MSSLTVLDFKAQGIRFENRDGQVWVSLTDMAKASGKLVGHWNALKSTSEYLQALQESIVIPIDQIIYSNESEGSNETRGTWAIDEVAIEFAGWCSVEFKIWANRQIKTLLSTGKVELNQEPQIPLMQSQGLAALETLHKVLETAKSIGSMRLVQQMEVQISQYTDAYVSLKQLPASNKTEQELKRYEGVIDVAIRLGLSIPPNLESSLGKFVKKTVPHLLQDDKDNRTTASSGKRLSVNLYPANNEEVENTVLAYCVLKNLI